MATIFAERLTMAADILEAATPDTEDYLGFRVYDELDDHVAALSVFLVRIDPRRAGRMLVHCGVSQSRRAKFDAVEINLQQALAINEAAYGPDHPEVAIALGNLGVIQQQLGRLDEAEATQTRALTIFEAAFGPEHYLSQQAVASLRSQMRQNV